jgi:ubiquinone biosynthesis protein
LKRCFIRDRERRAMHRRRQRGRLLQWSFQRLGAGFVKIGQVISSRPDVFCPEVIAELRQLQDHVPAFAYRKVREIIERELHARVDEVFRELELAPVAAGSIAQVHRGVLHDGSEVAVKVLRPGVRARVRRDAAILLALARMAEWLSSRARAADVRAHARSLVAGLIAQTDLGYEASNYERFRRDFIDTPGLAFPRVHHDVSTRDVLVMEFVRGESLARAPREQLPQVTRVMRASFFAMCFEHGLVHADLHPGNVLVRADGVLVLLDVGLVNQLAPETMDIIVDFARCLVMGPATDLVRHLQDHHGHRNVDWSAVELDVALFVRNIRGRAITELETNVVVGQLFGLARKHRIRPMPELSLMLLGMVTIEGVAKQLDPLANTMQEIATFLLSRPIAQRLARGSREWPAKQASESVAVSDALTHIEVDELPRLER